MPTTIVRNPLFLADFPDPSIIHVDGVFYMTTTSMHFMPGIPIMRSFDLAHWEIASFVYPILLDNPAHKLTDGRDIYGQGAWATSLRHHDGYFYVCFNCNDAMQTFIYRTRDILTGPWDRSALPGSHHDPSLLFDDDGRVFLVYGNGRIHIRELTADAMTLKDGGVDQVLIDTPKIKGLNCEGSHIHRIDDRYYLMLIQWPKSGTARRIQWCYRSDSLLGEYEGKIVLDDDLGYRNNGVAQGGFFFADGEWYALLFQDRDAVGRCPVLLPVSWRDGWPQLGQNGRVPREVAVPYPARSVAPFTASDEFDYTQDSLSPIWQWNHNPDDLSWSLVARPGYLRLTNGSLAPGFERARNTLTQRTVGPECAFWTEMDTSGLRPGDCAGIAALQARFGLVGVSFTDGEKRLVMIAGDRERETTIEAQPLRSETIYLKVHFNFSYGADLAHFTYSYDGQNWRSIGYELRMEYRLDHFVGYRAALFSYGTKTVGGYADFAFMRFEQR